VNQYLFIVFMLCCAWNAGAVTHKVCGTCNFKSVGQAIAQAQPGDIIFVAEGVYTEHDLVIDKPLTIHGEPGALINIDHKGFGFIIQAPHTTISGMVLRNVKTGSIKDYAAISVHETHHVTLRNNTIEGAFFGIHLFGVSHFTIQGNQVKGTVGQKMLANGIHTQNSRRGSIANNRVLYCRDGIYLEFTDSTAVEHNLVRANRRYGLHYMFSNHDDYRHNTFDKNEAGVAVMYSSHITMEHNAFTNNWGTASYGLLLKDIDDCRVYANTFDHNTSALFMDGSNRVQVLENTFRGSGWAVRLLANCTQPEINRNTFLGNVFDVATNGNPEIKSMRGNYWDKYRGYDLNKDTFGDVPFHPVSLYSVLVERQPELITLHRSLITNLIDWADRILPTMTPPNLIDTQPAMRALTYDH
jgi:nitrous oxidase accessory protein